MKQIFLTTLTVMILLTACKQHRYYDLTAGEYIKVEKDPRTGQIVNSNTHKPVYMYVDSKTNDTIYGATGDVINGHVIMTNDGKYKYDNEDSYVIREGDYKEKVDGDGVKIKSGDRKIKIEDGEKKVKNN